MTLIRKTLHVYCYYTKTVGQIEITLKGLEHFVIKI
jgi:hypothetical protein